MEENGFNRQDYTLDDIRQIIDYYGNMSKKYTGIAEKAAEALTSEDLEHLEQQYSYNLFGRIFKKYSYMSAETKAKLLEKCPKLLIYTKYDAVETYPMAVIRAYEKLRNSNERVRTGRYLSDECSDLVHFIHSNLDKVNATKELVDYYIEQDHGSPLGFLCHPNNKLKGWFELLDDNNKKIVTAVQNLNMYSSDRQIKAFFEAVKPLLEKDRTCYNSVVSQIKENILNEFKETFQKFANSPKYGSDSLEEVISNYNQFTGKFNDGLEPYMDKYRNAAKFQR